MIFPQTDGDHKVQALIAQCKSQIERCFTTRNLKLGKLLHAFFIKTSLDLHVFLANRLVGMYAICGSLECARYAFDEIPRKNVHSWYTILGAFLNAGQLDTAHRVLNEMPEPDLVSYNSVISRLRHCGRNAEVLDVFRLMQRRYGNGIVMDGFTVTGIVGACAGLANLELLRQVHGVVILVGLELNEVAYNTMIDAYGKCGDPDGSHQIFYQMPSKDVFSWNSLLGGYLHSGLLEEACRMFDSMPLRDVVSWTMMISRHVQNGHGEKALEIFREMTGEDVIAPNSFTFVSVLSACASLALIGPGKQLHGHIMRSRGEHNHHNGFLSNALIDMYAKCGDMGSAVVVFEMMPEVERDIVSWNSIITGFAQHGQGKQSLAIFERMRRSAITPNHVTFLGILSACNHKGLVSEGRCYFSLMEKEYAVLPRREHYAVLVDLLGRNCLLKEAVELLERMPNGSGLNDTRCWGSLLAACRVHGNVDLARRAAESLFKMEPANVGRYVMLSNIYAAAGLWDNSRKVRDLIRDKGLMKEPACSWIEVGNVRHAFVAEDKSHPQAEEIYQMLAKLLDQVKESESFFYDGNMFGIPDG